MPDDLFEIKLTDRCFGCVIFLFFFLKHKFPIRTVIANIAALKFCYGFDMTSKREFQITVKFYFCKIVTIVPTKYSPVRR